jgi:hypothetical protein
MFLAVRLSTISDRQIGPKGLYIDRYPMKGSLSCLCRDEGSNTKPRSKIGSPMRLVALRNKLRNCHPALNATILNARHATPKPPRILAGGLPSPLDPDEMILAGEARICGEAKLPEYRAIS